MTKENKTITLTLTVNEALNLTMNIGAQTKYDNFAFYKKGFEEAEAQYRTGEEIRKKYSPKAIKDIYNMLDIQLRALNVNH